MPRIAILFGLILIVIGAAGYFLALYGTDDVGEPVAASAEEEQRSDSTKTSWTALIPVPFGLILVICGVVGMNPSRVRFAMHCAAGITLLGALMATGRGIPSAIKVFTGAEGANSRATMFVLLMAAACWGFVLLAFQSFLKARASGRRAES